MHGIKVKTTIYVGLNDSVTGVQKFDTQRYIEVMHHVFRHYQVPFSYHQITGGSFHEDGRFTQENTLEISLIDTDRDTVMNIAKDLCAFFHQESVLVSEAPCSTVFVQESIRD